MSGTVKTTGWRVDLVVALFVLFLLFVRFDHELDWWLRNARGGEEEK